jgi:hypothetical protein
MALASRCNTGLGMGVGRLPYGSITATRSPGKGWKVQFYGYLCVKSDSSGEVQASIGYASSFRPLRAVTDAGCSASRDRPCALLVVAS